MSNNGRTFTEKGPAPWRSLRVKVVALVGCLTVMVMVAIVGLSSTVLEDGYAEVERKYHENTVQRLHTLIDADIQDLSETLGRWAYWDSAVSYTLGYDSEAFRASTLTSAGMEGLSADFVMLVDWRGRTLVSQQLVGQAPQGIQVVTTDLGIPAESHALRGPNSDEGVDGLIETLQGPAIISSKSILSSGKHGQPIGTLLFGRFLTPTYFERLSAKLGTAVVLTGVGARIVEQAGDLREYVTKTGPDAALAVSFIDLEGRREAVGRTVIRDIEGRPCTLLEVRLARDIWLQGQEAARLFLWTAIGVCLLLGIAGVMAMEFLVVRRIGRLAESAKAIGAGQQVPMQVPVEGSDELGQLGLALNEMLARLDATHRMVRESELRLREAQAAGRIGSWRYDPTTYESQWSDEVYRIHGMALTERPLHVSEAFGATEVADSRDPVDALARGIVSGQPFEFERRIKNRADGMWRIVLVRGHARMDDTVGHIVISGTIQDVTANRALEAERSELQSQLWHAQKLDALGTLAGGVAHELNNVLGPVVAYSCQMLKHGGLQNGEKQKIEAIHRAGERATELVRQILMFGRKRSAEHRKIVLDDLLSDVLLMVSATFPSTIEVSTSVASGPDGKKVTVAGDPGQLHSVLLNICVNAGQAMKVRGGRLEIRVSAERIPGGVVEHASSMSRPLSTLADGMYARIDIEDTGDGIKADVLPRIFEPFFTTKSVGEGTGLGLSLVHGVVTSHGGTVLVRSTPGLGTVFTVLLPLVSQDEAGEAVALVAARPPEPVTLRVLYVDDEPAMREIVSELLPEAGMLVDTAASASEAILRLGVGKPPVDVVVTDQTMPGMTGMQLAARVREQWPHVPVVMCTGYVGAVEAASKELGIEVCLQKPFDLDQLVGAIREAWALKHGVAATTPSPSVSARTH